MIRRFLRAAAAALALLVPAAFAQSVPGEPSRSAKAIAAPQLRLAPSEATPAVVTLAPLSAAEVEALRASNRRTSTKVQPNAMRINIGLERGGALEAPAASSLAWKAVDGGRAAQLRIVSPGAEALRVAIDLTGVPLDVEMRFASAAGRVEAPVRVGDIADRTQPWWSPLVEGESVTMEIFAPEGVDAGALRAVRVSHLLASPTTGLTKRLQDIGLAGACNVDIQCSTLNGDAAFRNAVESVTQLVFQDAGFTGLCTGTLLNDSDQNTQVPYVFSANHCFENENAPYKTPSQMQTVANTVSTIWGFQATTCGSLTPRVNWQQVFGGAVHLYNDPRSDVLFIRLNNAPPSYAFFAGWDASTLSINAPVVTIHHPEGDLKKVSQGNVRAFPTLSVVGPGGGSFIEVLWSTGTTEPGSSGSGLFTATNGQYVLRGGLWGGTALCTNKSGTDNFSRLDQAYPSISAYLGTGAAAPGPTADFTDLWWAGVAEDGWGLNLIQHASKLIFGVWYTYDSAGRRTWFVFSDGAWTGTNVYQATLYSTSGPSQSGSFDPNQVRRTAVGSVTLTFTDANNGTMRWTVNGAQGQKTLTRYNF